MSAGRRDDLLRAVLPVLDSLERGIQSMEHATDMKVVLSGLTLVQRQFVDALAKEGVLPIPTVGKPFDPAVHEAMEREETKEFPSGTVVKELRGGYTDAGRLVRAAMVVVAHDGRWGVWCGVKRGDWVRQRKPDGTYVDEPWTGTEAEAIEHAKACNGLAPWGYEPRKYFAVVP